MKKIITMGVLLIVTGCSLTNYATHPISITPTTTRQARIYETHVVIITKTTMTHEHYNRIIATTIQNKEERK